MILLITSLIAGFLTVLAPCTIALLPVIIGGTLSGSANFRRTLTIIISLGVSVIIFTLLLKVSTSLIAVPESFWELFSGSIVIVLGLTMLFPALWERLSFLASVNASSNKWLAAGFQKQNALGDILIGAALGPVFSSCSPTYFLILATVLPRSLIEGLFYLLVYTLGLCVGLLIVARASQGLMDKLGTASDARSYIKRGIGALFLLLGIGILTGYEKRLELYIAEHVYDVTQIEQKLLQFKEEMPRAVQEVSVDASDREKAKAKLYSQAPEITGISDYINTEGRPITFGEFKGKKVVLVDFWTYSCINCKRTIPYLTAWDDRYRDKGLVIVGVHTPEFAFEKIKANVEREVTNTFRIEYPVILDNDFATWNAFGNHYWPRKYLIDIDGYIVYDHIGEGEYEETERQIQNALAERARVLGLAGEVPDMGAPIVLDVGEGGEQERSPETYFGASRNEFLKSGTPHLLGTQAGVIPTTLETHQLYLKGQWNIHEEYASNAGPASIVYRFSARDVYFVARSDSGARVRLFLDGAPLGASAGRDVGSDSTMTITRDGLYELIKLDTHGEHTLEIQVEEGILNAYTFTFG